MCLCLSARSAALALLDGLDRTLLAWDTNFRAAWPALRTDPQLDERFYRMWRYYLLSLAGAFRARTIHLWQIVMSKHGLLGGYESVR